VRRYGFQGISHAYVAARMATLLGRDPTGLNLITLHLGGGASAAALRGGRCVDTSMGMTPLEGLIMASRCGDLDPAVPAYVGVHAKLSRGEVEHQLNHASGLRGLCGDNDVRAILARRRDGDADAALALKLYAYRVRKYIGAYLAVLGRVDALVFTAGVGEHAAEVRADICQGLAPLGLELDPARNQAARGVEAEIGMAGRATAIWVIPTQEEAEIARQVRHCLAPTP
jgi:acetate kinase